jgi:archaellum component FlaC
MSCHYRHTGKIRCFVSADPYYDGMTTLAALEQRVITLEDFREEQLPHTMAAMKEGMTGLHAQAVENNEAIARLRHDMINMETAVRGDISVHGHTINQRFDGLRLDVAIAFASSRTAVTNLGDAMSARFERVGGQIRGVQGDVGAIREDVGSLKHDFGSLKEEVTAVKDDVTTLKGDVTTVKDDVTTLKDDVTTVKDDVTTVKDDVTTLKGDVAGLRGDAATLKSDVTGLNDKVTGLDVKLDTLIAEIRGNRN